MLQLVRINRKNEVVMSWLFSCLAEVQEYKEWGFNFLTLGFLCTVVLTFWLQLPGVLAQLKTLWYAEKADGVDTTLAITLVGFYAIFLIYGVDSGSGGVLLNALVLGPWFGLILWQLWRIKGFTIFQWSMLGAWVVAVPVDLFTPWKMFFYIGATSVALYGPWLQFKLLTEKGTTEGFNPEFPKKWCIVCVFWIFYGAVSLDLFMTLASVAFAVLYWQLYRHATYLEVLSVVPAEVSSGLR